MNTYTYYPEKDIDTDMLKLAVKDTPAITARVFSAEYFNDIDFLKVIFCSELTPTEESIFEAIIDAHDADINPRVTVTDINKTLAPYELVVGVVGLTTTRTITLPLASQVSPLHILSIADEDESCKGNRKMKLVAQGADTISGVTEAKQPGSVLFARSNGVDTWVVRAI